MSDFDQIPWSPQYAGEFVAVNNGEVVAHSREPADVYRSLNEQGIRGAVIQKVPEQRR